MLKKIFMILVIVLFVSSSAFSARYVRSTLSKDILVISYDAKFNDLSFIKGENYVHCQQDMNYFTCDLKEIYDSRLDDQDILEKKVKIYKNPYSRFIR